MVKFIATLFWLLIIFVSVLISSKTIPFHPTFPYFDTDLSPRYPRLVSTPAFFDSIHYLRLAKNGYRDEGSQAFFPLYPSLINFGQRLGLDPLVASLCLNTLSLIGLMFLLPTRAYLLLLAYPASFYLSSVYTEALFLFLLALSFYFLSTRRLLLSVLSIALLSATRLVGLVMLIPLAFTLYPSIKKMLLYLPIAIAGFISYLAFLWYKFGDPLMFFHVQPLFGGGREGEGIVLLPRVLYRYLKIFLTVPLDTWLYWRSFLEFAVFGIFLYLLYHFRRRLSRSALIYCLLVLLIPSLSGTLSSMPRYALAALPIFVVVGESLSRRTFVFVLLLLLPLLTTLTMIFASGDFVA